MNERIVYLKEETISGRNKCKRTALPKEFHTGDLPYSLPERKALGLKKLLENMPLYIGEQELIIGTRTYFKPNPGNEDSHNIYEYNTFCGVPYVNQDDIALFGKDESFVNKNHYTPDMNILLEKGIGGMIASVDQRLEDPTLNSYQKTFLNSIRISYEGFSNLFIRYATYGEELVEEAIASGKDPQIIKDWNQIVYNCKHLSKHKPENFLQAVQLLWLGHLVMTIECFEFNCYGRLDYILQKYVKEESKEEILEILECLLLKMYDQTDIVQSYLNKYASQLVVTLGGIDENGENAVGTVSMLFLEAIDHIRLPDPEFNLRIHSKNPPEFLDKACELTISGCNFISYYNDDLFVANLKNSGMEEKYANMYGFDLCEDIIVPGRSDYFCSANIPMINILMNLLLEEAEFETFEALYLAYKEKLAMTIAISITEFNNKHRSILAYRDGDKDEFFRNLKEGKGTFNWGNRSLMCPLPILSSLYHGCVETAFDITEEGYTDKNKGVILGTVTECINSLAALKKVVFEEKRYTLQQVVAACKNDYKEDEILRKILWLAPKWGNDDDYVDDIGKDLLAFGMKECDLYSTPSGGKHLVGIHQPHPVPTGAGLMATPEGRHKGVATAVTLTPESGTMKNGPTAALKSGAKIDSSLVHWNYCVMVNYFASTFQGNDGKGIFKNLLQGYFSDGGLQHQPNILDVEELKKAQLEPEQYKDLIVRLWGVSAHFVDLPLNLQNEMIERFGG